jgi:MFS family permease
MTAIRTYARRVMGFRRNAKLYLVCTVLRSATTGLSALVFNLYLLSMGFDASFVGLTSTLTAAASVVSCLPAGLIADRIGRKRAMLVGLMGMSIAQFGVAVSVAGPLIAACAALSGALGALYLTSGAPLMMENSSTDERATLFTLNSSLANLVAFVVSAAGGYMPCLFSLVLGVGQETAPAYRGVMLVAALATLLAMVPALSLTEQTRAHALPGARRSTPVSLWPHLWRQFSNPRLLVQLVIPQALMMFGAGLVFPFINLFYKQRFGVSDAVLGWILGVTSLTAALVMLLGGGVADRLGKMQTLFYARAISIPLLLIIGYVPILPIAAGAHWTRSGFMRVGDPLYQAFAMEQLAEHERATGSSLITMGSDLGSSLGPVVSGLVQVHSGFGPLFAGTAACYVLSLGFIYVFFLRR